MTKVSKRLGRETRSDAVENVVSDLAFVMFEKLVKLDSYRIFRKKKEKKEIIN